MELGTKVKCKGYWKKLKTKNVISENQKENGDVFSDVSIVLNESNDYQCQQDLYEYIDCEFEGIVVQKKTISLLREFEYDECNPMYENNIIIYDWRESKCYKVYFRMGGSRLVPVDMCEIIKEVQ